MSEEIEKDEQERGREVVDAVLHMARCLGTVRLPGSITPERLEALELIKENEPMGITALAKVARVRPATMSRMVSALVDDGLARRKGDKVDLRAVSIHLTARGRQVLKRSRELLIRRTAAAVSQLSSEEVAMLPRLASKLRSLQEGDS